MSIQHAFRTITRMIYLPLAFAMVALAANESLAQAVTMPSFRFVHTAPSSTSTVYAKMYRWGPNMVNGMPTGTGTWISDGRYDMTASSTTYTISTPVTPPTNPPTNTVTTGQDYYRHETATITPPPGNGSYYMAEVFVNGAFTCTTSTVYVP